MRFVFVGLGVAALALAACQPTPTAAEAAATFCGDLRALNRTVIAFNSTTGVTTVGEFQQRMGAVSDAWTDVKESAKAVPQARVDQLETAVNDLKSTVDGLPKDGTLNQAADTVRPKAVAVGAARQQVGSGVRCPGA